MKLLEKENWWIWLLLAFFSGGSSILVLGALFDIYRKDAWYAKWYWWVLGFVCFFMPFAIMMMVISIYALTQVCAKLEVPGKEIYLSYYLWILCLIIPILGWAIFMIMYFYLWIGYLVCLCRGNGEAYLNY